MTSIVTDDTWGKFLSNIVVSEQPGETQGPCPIWNIQIEMCYPFSMERAQAKLLNKLPHVSSA